MNKNRKMFFGLILVSLLAACGTSIVVDDEESSSSIYPSESSSSNSSSASSSPSGSGQISSSSSSEEDIYGLWDHSQDIYRYGETKIEMVNFNDFHGTVEYSSSNSEPGITRISTYIKQMQESWEGTPFLLTSSGDMWQGSCDSNLTRGRLVTDWMNALNFDAMCIGNHEFDWGIDNIISNEERMSFPLLSSNIYYRSTNQPVEWTTPYTTVTKYGLRIGIVGAIGAGQTSDILASIVKDYKFVDPNPIITSYANFLKENGADIVVCLIHDTAENITTETADAVDAIFCGHTHTGENVLLGSNGQTPAVQAYSNGKDLSEIKLNYNFDNGTVICTEHNILDLRYVAKSLEEDSETLSIYQYYLDTEISAVKDRVVGYTNTKIDSTDLVVMMNKYLYQWYIETQYSNFHYDIYRVTHNNARSSMPKGNITYGNIYKAFPFDNKIVICSILGSYLKKAEYGTHLYPNGEETIVSNKTYYILTIDYISEYSASYMNTVVTFDSIFPRDIMADYIGNDYPVRG